MKQINSIILNTNIVNLFSLLFLFSTLFNYYIPTAILPELLFIVSLFLIILQNQRKIYFDSIIFVLLYMYIFFYAFILNQEIGGDLKEAYRFLSISIMIFILQNLKVNFNGLIYFSVIITRLLVIYVVYEFIVINFYGLSNDIFYKQIVAYYNTDVGQYFTRTWDFGIPLYRPFGISFQPQKSGFIFPMAILIQYIYKKNINSDSYTILWNFIFIFATFISMGKTALLLSIILVIVLNYKIFIKNNFLLYGGILMLIYISIFIYIKMISKNMVVGTTLQDIQAYYSLPLINIIFGLGYISTNEYYILNFAHETFFIRLLVMFGLINFILIFITLLYILRKRNIVTIAIFLYVIFSILHYAILNYQYYLYLLSLIIVYNRNNIKLSSDQKSKTIKKIRKRY